VWLPKQVCWPSRPDNQLIAFSPVCGLALLVLLTNNRVRRVGESLKCALLELPCAAVCLLL
jgi:hypothetical protein